MTASRFGGLFVLALLFLAVPVGASAQATVGTVVRLVGQAKATGAAGVRSLTVDSPLLPGDAIETGGNSRALVRFADDSLMTLGQNAHVVVDQMVYVKDSAEHKQVLAVLKGVFRYVSSKLMSDAQKSVSIRTPVATVGIRGTDFVGGEFAVGMAAGQLHYGFQLREGAIDVIAPGGAVALTQPGQGTFLPLKRIAPPTVPLQWSAEATAEADEALKF